jgi:hypothetical protein
VRATSETVRYNNVEPRHSRPDFGVPMREERPPASTTPAAVSAPVCITATLARSLAPRTSDRGAGNAGRRPGRYVAVSYPGLREDTVATFDPAARQVDASGRCSATRDHNPP